MFHRNTEEEEFSQKKIKIFDRKKNPVENDLTGTTLEKTRPFDQVFAWYRKLNEQIRSMMKSGSSQQKLLVLIDNYIDSLNDNSATYIKNTKRCCWLAKEISCALFLFKDLNRTSTETHEYLIKICELLSFYTFLELKFSSKFNSSKVSIAERISSNYDVHLKDVNISYTLRVFLSIPTLFSEKEIMSKIFQKYLNRQQHITQTEVPDRLYCMYLIAYSKWMSLESDDYERTKICESANKNVKPMKSLSSNKLYAPFLPVYEHSDCDATKHILSKRINTKLLTRVLINDECRKENIIIINLSDNDTLSTSNILEDTNWTNISPPNQNKTSVKIESPLVLEIIDLTKDEPTLWEVSWLNNLLRKSRTSMPALNIFASNLVGALEVINIHDDDDDDDEDNNFDANSTSDSNQCKNTSKSEDQKKLVNLPNDCLSNNINNKNQCTEENLSVDRNSVMEHNSPINEDVCSVRKEKKNFSAEKSSVKSFQTSNSITISHGTKNIINTSNKNDNKNSSSHKNVNEPYIEDSESTVSPKLPEKNIYISKKLYNFNVSHCDSLTSNDLFMSKTPKDGNIMSNIEIFANEEDAEDINSPPVERFSESDADEFVQLIDKNTKEANATNLYFNQEKHPNTISLTSETSPLHTVPTTHNSNTRKVSFAKLPDKHIATSNYFSNKSVKDTYKSHMINDPDNPSTKQSSINTTLPTSDLNCNQPKTLCNTLETSSVNSSVQDFISSTDCTSLPMSHLSHQNKVSGTIGYLFMKKFPPPTYRKLDNLDLNSKKNTNNITHPNNEPRINLANGKNNRMIKNNDNKPYFTDKKHMSDFDKYLEKLKEKRSKIKSTPKDPLKTKTNSDKKVVHSDKRKTEPKRKSKKILNKKKDVLQFVDEKLRNKSYVKIERIDISQYTNKKLNNFCKMKEKRVHEPIISANPYIRIKRIKNINLNYIKDIESANKPSNLVFNTTKDESNDTAISTILFKRTSEINSTVNDYYNSNNQNRTVTENRNNGKNSKINLITPSNAGQNSSHQQQKREKLVTSQSEKPKPVSNYIEIDSNFKQGQLKDLESEVTSTQDNGDLLGECKISSTQDISNTNINNSVQNNEIDTSHQVRHRRKRKSSIHSTNSHLSVKTNKQEHNFSGQGSSNKELNEPTTTTVNISTKKRGRKKKNTLLKNYKSIKKNNNDIIGGISFSRSTESPNLQTEVYSMFGDIQNENSTVAKTYSMHNLVSNVFVPPEVEKNFDDMT